MKQQQKNILLLGGFGLLFGVLATLSVLSLIKPGVFSEGVASTEDLLCIGDPQFDAAVGVPDTDIQIRYPKNGFFGLGADVKTGQREVHIEPTQSHISVPPTKDDPFGEAFYGVTLNASAAIKPVNQTLYEFVDALKAEARRAQTIESDYIQSGTYLVVPIDGQAHEFFTYHVTEDVEDWVAVGFIDDNVITLRLSAKPTSGKESTLARAYMPTLLREILSHITVE